MAAVHFYLLFDGNCKEAFDFYRSVFGGDFLTVIHYGDVSKEGGAQPVAGDIQNKIEKIQ